MDKTLMEQRQAEKNGDGIAAAFYRHLAEDASESAPAIFVVAPDDEYKLLFASASCRRFGNAPDCLLGVPFSDFIPTLTLLKLKQLWQEIDEYGRSSISLDYRLKSGQRIAVEIDFDLFEDEGKALMSGCIRDISDRRALEAERLRLAGDISRQETELRYREIFENVTDGIFLLDVEDEERFRFAATNPAFARITGLVPLNVIGRYIEEALPQDAAQKLIASYRHCAEAGIPTQYEVELELPAGYKVIESTLVPIRDGFGRIHRIIGLSSDITQRKASEREINFLAYSLDHMQDAVFVIDMQMRFCYVNQKACQSLGYSSQELLSMRIPDIDPYATEEEIQARVVQLLAGESGIHFETFHKTKDGRLLPVEISVSAFKYNGEWRRLAVTRDITERKRNEALIQERLELEQRFSRMAEHLPGFVFTFRWSPDGHFSFPYTSAGIRDIYGLQPEDVADDMEPLHAMAHPDDRRMIEDALEKAIATLTPIGIEFRIDHPTKGVRWLEAKSKPVVEPDGGVLYHGMMLDITERKRMEIEMRQQTEFQGILLDAMTDVDLQVMMIENGRIIFAGNRKLAHEFGYDNAALGAGPLLTDILHPEDQARVMDYYRRRLAGEAMPTSYELSLVTRSGERREYETAVAIVPGSGVTRIVTVGKDITERKRMEAALRDRERDFRSLAENLPDNVVRWDNRGRYVFVNPTNERTIGASSESVAGKRLGEAFPDGRFAVLEAAIDQVIANGEPVSFVRQLVPAEDGEMRIHDINLVPEFDEAGRIVSVLGIGRDMTDIYRLQETIATREQEFRSLAESSPDSIIRYDVDGRIRYLNSGLVRDLGLANAEEVLGKRPSEAWPDGRFAAIEAAAMQAVETASMVTIEMVRSADAEDTRYGSVVVVPERDIDGQIIGTIAFGRDITELKAAEAVLRESEQRLRLFFERQVVGMAFTSPEKGWLQVNDRICEMLGYSREELMRLTWDELTYPADLAPDLAQFERMLSGEIDSYTLEKRFIRKDGGIVFANLALGCVRKAHGTLDYVLVMIEDITERKLAEAGKQQLIDILEQSVDFIGSADLQGNLLYHNRAARRMVGLEDDADLSAMQINDMHPAEARQRIQEIAWPILLKHGVWRGENTLLHRDGHEIQVSQLLMLHRNADGEPTFASTIMTDITERKRIDDALKFIAQRGWQEGGESFLTALARYLGQILQMDYVIIDKLAEDPSIAETVAIYARGDVLPNMQYKLTGTPCHNVMEGQLCCYTANAQQLFPLDTLLVDMGVESYAGLPLVDSNGKTIGLIAIMDGKPMHEPAAITSLLQVVAARAAAELERERHDGVLRQQQHALTVAQRVAQVGSWEIDHVHDRYFWSDEMFRIFEIAPEEGASYEGCMNSVHPEDYDSVERIYFESLATQVPYDSEHRLLMADGRIKYVHERSETTYTPDGKPLRSLGMLQDITERKRAEETLLFVAQRSWQSGGESFLTALARYLGRTLQVDYVIIDKLADDPSIAETVAIYARGDVLPNMQYNLADTPCHNVMEGQLCCYAANAQQLFPLDKLLVDMGVESYAGLPLMDSSGKTIGLIAVMDGKPMQEATAVTSLLQLVATRAAAELEREQSERALADSMLFLNRVIDTIVDPVFVKDREHRWIRLNKAFCEFIGYPMDVLLGKSDYDFFPEEQADVFWAKDEAVFTSGEENVNEEEFTDSEGITHTIITKKTCYTDERGQQFLVGTIQDITEHKQHEQVLIKRAQLEEQLSALAASVPGFIFTIRTDIDRRVSFPFVSAGVKDLFGLTPEEVRGDAKVLRSRYHPDDLKRVLALMDETERKLSPFRIEIRILHAERGERWIEIRSTPYRQLDGSTEWHGLMIDITERRRDQRHLEVTQQRLQSVLQTIPDYVWLKDTQGNYLACNNAFELLLGSNEAQIVGKTDYDFVDMHTADVFRRKDREALQAGRVMIDEEWVTHATNNRQLLLETRKVPVYGAAGNIIGVLGIGRDITELKLRDERLTLLDYALDQVKDALYLIDEEARFVQVNAEACRGLGYCREELVGMQIFDIDPEYGPEDWQQYLALTQAGRASRTLERFHKRRDGSLFNVEVNSTYIMYHGRGYCMALVRDVTERKRTEALLLQRGLEFRTLVENLPSYVVRFDHDLRRIYVNPAYIALTGISESKLLGSHASEYWQPSNVSPEEYVILLASVLSTGEQKEVSLEWKDHAERTYSHVVRIAPEYAADGEVMGLLVLGFDITEHNREQRLESRRQRVFEMLAQGGELNEILGQIAQYVESATPGGHCCILLFDEEKGGLVSAAPPALLVPCKVSMEEVFSQYANKTVDSTTLVGKRLVEGEKGEYACPQSCRDLMRENGMTSYWAEPITVAGQLLGLVTLYHDRPGEADADSLVLLRQACYLSSIAIERKRIEEQMHHQASYDALTGLPNRRLFANRLHDEIIKADRNDTELALLFIDLDRFKEVNDTLGHKIGDQLLIEAARRIQTCVRGSDVVARLGGDEFVVVMPEVSDAAQLGRAAQQIIESLTVPFEIESNLAFVSASIGIACYPGDADNLDMLISRADQAMYAAKAQGRNCFGFFTASMQEEAQYRLRLMTDLRNSLNAEQLQVHYQPIIDIATGHVVKAEALVRWRHPVLGYVSPDQFIPIAEENGVIHEIGDWVFKQSADMVVRWKQSRQANDRTYIPCQVSVNISPRQFSRGNAEESWIQYLRDIKLNPSCMAIEITEGLLLDNCADINRKLERFRDSGMGVALDDFGTGYSAMGYLKKFHIDYLKIDRSFIRDLESDPNDRAIAEAIVVMAHKLGLKTIAEGVETAEQRNLLAAAGCEYIQGYLYAKPMPAEEFLQYVSSKDDTVSAHEIRE